MFAIKKKEIATFEQKRNAGNVEVRRMVEEEMWEGVLHGMANLRCTHSRGIILY